jgi:hypothetical protein
MLVKWERALATAKGAISLGARSVEQHRPTFSKVISRVSVECGLF